MTWKERNIHLHDENNIKGLFGKYRYLSNFHLVPIQYEGIVYPSTENAYMAAKSIVTPHDVDERAQMRYLAPSQAKEAGKLVTLRKDWEEVKVQIMYELNLQKFAWHPELRTALLLTENKFIEETNWWNDRVWGVCDGIGQNHLGIILMRIRKEIRDGKA